MIAGFARRYLHPDDRSKPCSSIMAIASFYSVSMIDQINLTLRDLRYLLAVAEYRHFGRAAEACSVSQPTLSVQVRKLEELLGVVLFERSTKVVVPTFACERL